MTQLEMNTLSALGSKETFPDIRVAGKVIPRSESAKKCFEEITPRPVTPPVVRKFIQSRRPDPGSVRRFYGKAGDPDLVSALVHGVKPLKVDGGLVINPEPKTDLQQTLQALQEAAYLRNIRGQLEKSHDQASGLPRGLDPYKTAFGVRTAQEITAGLIVNPPKSREQVERESQECHELYLRSHSAYTVGERISRNYNWSTVEKDCRFGLSTPHSNSGQALARSLRWLSNDGRIVSRRCEEFRERTQPQIGKVHDPIADTMNVPEDHTFGLPLTYDKFGLKDVLHTTLPEVCMVGTDRRRVLVTAVRQQLKKASFHDFTSLLQAFKNCDSNNQGFITKEDLQDVCLKFNLDLSTSILDNLMEFCEENTDGQINYLEFIDFLNWKKKMPINEMEGQNLTGEDLYSAVPARAHSAPVQTPAGTLESKLSNGPGHLKTADLSRTLTTRTAPSRPRTAPLSYRSITSSSLLRVGVGGLHTADLRTYGIPTVRSDLPPPRIKRISDRVNYGDQSTVHGLLSPTLYSLRGVHAEQFFSSRTKEEIAEIFHNVGVEISGDLFEEAWKLASLRHPRGEVCVEFFRDALREIHIY